MTELLPTPNNSRSPRPNRWRTGAFIIVGLIILGWFVTSSPAFKECVNHPEAANTKHPPQENSAVISRDPAGIELYTICVEDWTEKYEGAIAAIATIFIAIFTLTLWQATKRLWESAETQLAEFRNSLRIADQHAGHMASSVDEAARAASAMEMVAESFRKNTEVVAEMAISQRDFGQRHLRAYLSAIFGTVVPQDDSTKWRTEVRLVLVNNGSTPAYDVYYKANAQVLPFPLPEHFDFPIPDPPQTSASVIGPHQNIIMSCPLPNLLNKSEIDEYTQGVTKRVYMWGIAYYKDAFGIDRTTKFCQNILWLRGGGMMGVNTRRHNEAD